jgi:hypothetical protein
MKKVILSLFISLLTINAFAQRQTRFDLLPYASYINYNNAVIKNSSIIAGLYGYYGAGLKHTIEGDVAYNRIKFDEFFYEFEGREYRTEPFTINQADITLIYSNYMLNNLKWRFGSHAIFNNDSLTDKSFIVFGGLQRYRPYQYNAGIDVYVSWYNNFTPAITVLQATGTFGFYFGNYFTSGNFYAETKGHYIKLSEDIGFGDKQYASVEAFLIFIKISPWADIYGQDTRYSAFKKMVLWYTIWPRSTWAHTEPWSNSTYPKNPRLSLKSPRADSKNSDQIKLRIILSF